MLRISGTSRTSPIDSRATKDVAQRLAPATTGPSVMTASTPAPAVAAAAGG